MIVSKLIYLAVIALLAGFSILYVDSLALVMLCGCLLLPFFLIFVLLYGSSKMAVSLNVKTPANSRNKKVEYQLVIKKANKFPVCCKVKIAIKNNFTGQIITRNIWASTCETEKHLYGDLICEHCGSLQVTFIKAYAYDVFKLFRKKIKTDSENEILILPELCPIDGILTTMPSLDEESNLYSNDKKGNDPSELFDIREFREGDNPRKIHWNLSSKTEGYMVKEFGLPLKNSIVILFEREQTDKSLQDSKLDLFLSLSNFLLEQNVSHYLCWYNLEHGLNFCSVTNIEELYGVIGGFLSESCIVDENEEKHLALEEYVNSEKNKHTHLIYITADEKIAEYSFVKGQQIPITAMVVTENQDIHNLEQEDFRCLVVKPEEISQGFAGLEL